MKKIMYLSLLFAALYSCSHDETENTATEAKQVEQEASVETLSKTEILSKYGKNRGEIGLTKAREAFAADCKVYLTDSGIATDGLDNDQIINLFMKNF